MANSRDPLKLTPTAAAFPANEDHASETFTHSTAFEEDADFREVVIYLDPHSVHIPNTPNRLPDAFEDEAFEALRLGILSGGSNVEAIGVRKVFDSEGGFIYVLVFGERRLRVVDDNYLGRSTTTNLAGLKA